MHFPVMTPNFPSTTVPQDIDDTGEPEEGGIEICMCTLSMFTVNVSHKHCFILDTFENTSSEVTKRKRGRPRKLVDSDQPAPTHRPVGCPRHVSAFGSHSSQPHVVSVYNY